MKLLNILVVSLISVLTFYFSYSAEYDDSTVIVSVKDEKALASEYQIKSHLLDTIYSVWVPQGKTVEEFIKELKEKPYIEFAEPNYKYKLLDTIPNDEFILNQWGLSSINAFKAWDIETGSSDVVVAIVDSGVDYTHVDLKDNLWKNPDEICDNGRDDDQNGYIDDCYGWNALEGIGSGDYTSSNHGTAVAGVIAAVGNNGIGIAGVGWNVKVMSCTAGNYSLFSEDIAQCFSYILKQKFFKGVNIVAINASFGEEEFSKAAEKLINILDTFGIILVSAAGNDITNTDNNPIYPCAYNSDNIICVGALTPTEDRAVYSNYGYNTVDIFAPGEDILTTVPMSVFNSELNTYGYDVLSGTSLSAPFVAGAVALLKSHEPNLSVSQIKERILSTSRLVSNLYGQALTCGKLDIFNMLTDTSNPKFCMNLSTSDEYIFISTDTKIDVKTGIIRNVGKGYLDINNIYLTDNQYFHILEDECSGKSLEFLEECKIKIAFTPPFSVSTPDFSDITSNLYINTSEGDYTFTLKGDFSINAIQNSVIEVSKKEIYFKNVSVNGQKSSLLKIKNTSNKDIKLRLNLVKGQYFYIKEDTDERPCLSLDTLPKDDYCFVEIVYNPQSAGYHYAMLSIVGEDPKKDNEEREIGFVNVNLKGSTEATPEITTEPDSQIIKLVKSKNTQKLEKEIKVINNSPYNLNILDIEVLFSTVGMYIDVLSGTNPCDYMKVLPPYQECTFKVVFIGDNTKENYSMIIRIKSNDKLEPNKILYVLGILEKPKIKLEPSSINFEKLMIGKEKEEIIKVINSSQEAPLLITDITFKENQNAEFSIDLFEGDRPCGKVPFSILEDDYCTLSVKFEPKTVGKKKEKVLLYSGEDTKSISLSGEAIEPIYPLIVVEPKEYDFGTVIVNQTVEETFSIENQGFSELVVEEIKIGKDFSLDLNKGANPCGSTPVSIQPNQKCTFGVVFSPQKDKKYKSSIEIKSNDYQNKKLKINLYAEGRYESPIISVTPREYDFGGVFIGNTEEKEFIVKNTGELQLQIFEIKLKNENFKINLNGGFNPCGTAPIELEPEEVCTFTVAFQPQKEKREKATIEIKSNDPINDKFKIYLYGTGLYTAPYILVSPDNIIDLGKVPLPQTAEKTLIIKNLGNSLLTVYEIKPKLKDNVFEVDANGGDRPCGTLNDIEISPRDYCTIKIRFTPLDTKEYESSLEIKSNAPDRKKIKLKILGYGRPTAVPAIYLSTREIDTYIPTKNACEIISTVLIKNTGEGILKVENTPSKTIYAFLECIEINPGETCPLTIWLSTATCEAIKEADKSKTIKEKIKIRTNDPLEEEVTIDVKIHFYNPEEKDDQTNHIALSRNKKYPMEIFTYVGEVSFPYVIQVSNISQQAVNIEDMYLSDNEEFSLEFDKRENQGLYIDKSQLCNGRQVSLLPGEKCDVLIYLTPKKEGHKEVFLFVKESNGAVSEYRISTAAILPKQNYVYIDPEIFDEFENVPPNTQSDIKTLKVVNIRETSIKLSDIELIDTTGEFELVQNAGDNPCSENLQIESNQSCTIGIRFKPTSQGIKNATLKVTLSDDSILISKIYGRSITDPQPHIVIKPRQIYTGLTYPKTLSSPYTITIKNIGNTTLNITDIYPDSIGNVMINYDYGSNPCGSKSFSLDAGQECTIGVLYEPLDSNDSKSGIYVESNDPLFSLAKIPIYADTDIRNKTRLGGGGCSYGATTVPIWLLILIIPFFRRLKQNF
ncbi:MAG: choice-of-anchor D domain-containing protein [Aquificae bacterium]|nr:choice-of-anchor D domain-containing protein [Aquificota bacterium]